MTSEIDSIAAQWVARLDRADVSGAEQAALESWLSADRRHRGAFARAQAVMTHFDRGAALGTHFDPAQFAPVKSTTRRLLVALLAASVAAVVMVLAFVPDRTQELLTRRGEVRLVPMIDGSAITLNTASKVEVAYSDSARSVRLIQGEALFNVAKDAARPFVVEAGSTRIRAIGTSFTVRHLEGHEVKVIVREGAVEVSRDDAHDLRPVLVQANELVYSTPRIQSASLAVPDDEVSRQMSWQQGMISLDGMTLAEAAREFARYSDVRIVIDDPTVASRTVTGLFAASNPVGFARAVATSMNLEAAVEPDSVHLLPRQ